MNGGVSFRTADLMEGLSKEEEDYMKDLLHGGHFSADAGYFISESIGLGLKYNHFGSSNSMQNVTLDVNSDGYPETGAMKDNINISFIGPMVSSMVWSGNRKNALFFNLALGYLHYLDKGELIGYDVKMKGSTFGMVGDIGYQIGLSEALSLAFTCSYTIGTLSEMKVELGDASYTLKLEDDKKENLGRIDLSVGLVFHR